MTLYFSIFCPFLGAGTSQPTETNLILECQGGKPPSSINICHNNVVGKCRFGMKCKFHHYNMPYLWCIKHNGRWVPVTHENSEIEFFFSHPNYDSHHVAQVRTLNVLHRARSIWSTFILILVSQLPHTTKNQLPYNIDILRTCIIWIKFRPI